MYTIILCHNNYINYANKFPFEWHEITTNYLLQKECIDFTMIKPGIDATLNVMNGLLDEKGEHLSNLEQGNLDSLVEECGVKTS